MTFKQWVKSAIEHKLCDLSEDEFHEMTGDYYNHESFSYADHDADAIFVHSDHAWLERYVDMREGATSYKVVLPIHQHYFSDLTNAQAALWVGHSSYNT